MDKLKWTDNDLSCEGKWQRGGDAAFNRIVMKGLWEKVVFEGARKQCE